MCVCVLELKVLHYGAGLSHARDILKSGITGRLWPTSLTGEAARSTHGFSGHPWRWCSFVHVFVLSSTSTRCDMSCSGRSVGFIEFSDLNFFVLVASARWCEWDPGLLWQWLTCRQHLTIIAHQRSLQGPTLHESVPSSDWYLTCVCCLNIIIISCCECQNCVVGNL